MTAVYSSRIIQESGFSGGPSVVYVCPPGVVTLVKCITIVWGDVTVSGLDAWAQDFSGAKLVRRTIAAGVQPYEELGGCDVFYGSWVYYPGESLLLQTATGTCDFTAAGFQLAEP